MKLALDLPPELLDGYARRVRARWAAEAHGAVLDEALVRLRSDAAAARALGTAPGLRVAVQAEALLAQLVGARVAIAAREPVSTLSGDMTDAELLERLQLVADVTAELRSDLAARELPDNQIIDVSEKVSPTTEYAPEPAPAPRLHATLPTWPVTPPPPRPAPAGEGLVERFAVVATGSTPELAPRQRHDGRFEALREDERCTWGKFLGRPELDEPGAPPNDGFFSDAVRQPYARAQSTRRGWP